MSLLLWLCLGLGIVGLGWWIVNCESKQIKHDRWLKEWNRHDWTRGEDGPCWKWAVLQRKDRA